MSCTESRENCTPKSSGARKHETPNLGSGTARDKGPDQRLRGCLCWYRKLKGVTVKLRVVPNARCQVPIRNKEEYLCPLKEKFDQILDSWHSLDIIEDVGDELTDWCSNVVLTPKDSGKSRHNRR